MKNVSIQKTIKVSLTANQWELYSGKEANAAALMLNRSIEYVFGVFSKESSRLEMHKIMQTVADLGALDTEPRNVLEDLLDLFYGECSD